MTTEQFKQRQDDLDAKSDFLARLVIWAGCLVITLAWIAVLAHWGAMLI